MKKLQENLSKSDIKPLFADEVIVITPVRAIKEKKTVKKEGHVVFVFMDMLSQQPIAKIVLSKTTAQSFNKILGNVLVKLEKDLKSKDMPAPEPIKTDSTKYIE
jgi:hypothetical protein